MNIISFPPRTEWKQLLARPMQEMAEIEQKVLPILQKVKLEGDAALREFALKFDKIELTDFQVSQTEIDAAENHLSEDLKAAIQQAYKNIYTFHEAQKQTPQVIETMAGIRCWQIGRASCRERVLNLV